MTMIARDPNGDPVSANASVCWSCSVCNCEWLRNEKPVPGWETEPTKLPYYARKGGLRVVACPKMRPFTKRVTDNLMAPEPERRRYEKRKSAV